MEGAKIVAICQFGGEFVLDKDGSMSYSGGDAHVIDIDHNMLFDELKSEIAGLFNVDINTVSIKYFLPTNKRTLITISSDKDLKRMVNFYSDSATTDIYVLSKVDNRATGSVVTDSSAPIAATATATADRNVRRRLSANNRTRTRVANGATADNGRQGRSIAGERANNRTVATDSCTSIIATPVIDDCREQSLASEDRVDDRENGSIMVDLGASIVDPNTCDDAIAEMGQEFDNVRVFRDELCKYAFRKGFAYKFIKNEHSRLTARCSAEGCPWRIHASRSSRKKTFLIRKVNNVHTCGMGNCIDRRKTTQWMASIIKDKLRETPNLKPKDIVADLYRDYGISLNYYQAWRGKEIAQKELHNLQEEACNQLPWFCERIIETNPGSVAMLAASQDSKFRRVFVSFYASLHGFEHGCRPLLFLDKIPLRTNNEWKLLAAASVDGDDNIFPVAFAAVEADTYEGWLWFLIQLKYAVTTSRSLTFVSSRHKGLKEAVALVFEDFYHSYCLLELIEDFKGELKKGSWSQATMDTLVDDFKYAAQACTTEDFNQHIESIRSVSNDLAEWIMGSGPEHWSNALFNGPRYDHFSPNMVKSFSSWIPVKHESSVVLMVEAIRSKIMDVLNARREASQTWENVLTPTMEQKLQKEIPKSALYVVCSSDTVFEVRWNTVNVVNIGAWECTCKRWQITGLPCTHAIAVFDRLGKNMYDYCSRYFRTETYRLTYSESVHPIPNVERINSIFGSTSYPPRPNRPPGRPRRKRINPHKTTIRPLHCSRCKVAGHNKATCEAII